MSKDYKMFGTIYLRDNEWFRMKNVIKLGIATFAKDRSSTYITGEVERGEYICVIEIPLEIMTKLDKCLKTYFKRYHVYYGGGTEFYKRDIIGLVELYLQKINVPHKVLTREEIEAMNRSERIQHLPTFVKNMIKRLVRNKYRPRAYQTEIIQKSVAHFREHDKGLLVLTCGVGKTLISLWIAKALQSKSILIGVPTKLLLNQWEETARSLFKCPFLIVSDGITEEEIRGFLKEECVVITTYKSVWKVNKVVNEMRYVFDMNTLDECHHVTTAILSDKNTYVKMLDIPATKQISLTATLKEGGVISNEKVEYFGEIMDKRCLSWAIRENIICDYVIQTIISNEVIDVENKRLYLSAFAALKSIADGHSHHLLIYSNNQRNSEIITDYLKQLLVRFNLSVYYSCYHSDIDVKKQKGIIDGFNKATYGIISCVYCLGEGYDNPVIDGVVFAENMSSNIRIVQSALRGGRKNKKDPNKIAKIILPILNTDWLDETPDLKQVRKVIYQMGQEDETIRQKIKVFQMSDVIGCRLTEDVMKTEDLQTDPLGLKTSSRNMTYEKARKIIVDKNIKTIREYEEYCEEYRLPRDPKDEFTQFTNWMNYLSMDREKYYDLKECKTKVDEYIRERPELKKYYLELSTVCTELCKLDPQFPPDGLWVDCYAVKDLRDIIVISMIKKGKGCI